MKLIFGIPKKSMELAAAHDRKVSLVTNEKDFMISAEIGEGFSADNVTITIHNGRVVIKGTK